MAIIIPAAAENALLARLLSQGDVSLKLYTNAVNVADDALVAAGFTEFTGLGYAAKTLTSTGWTTAQNGASAASATYATQTWTFTAGTAVTAVGYYVTDALSGALLWFEAFTSSKTVQSAGDQIIITPTITLSKV